MCHLLNWGPRRIEQRPMIPALVPRPLGVGKRGPAAVAAGAFEAPHVLDRLALGRSRNIGRRARRLPGIVHANPRRIRCRPMNERHVVAQDGIDRLARTRFPLIRTRGLRGVGRDQKEREPDDTTSEDGEDPNVDADFRTRLHGNPFRRTRQGTANGKFIPGSTVAIAGSQWKRGVQRSTETSETCGSDAPGKDLHDEGLQVLEIVRRYDLLRKLSAAGSHGDQTQSPDIRTSRPAPLHFRFPVHREG